MIYPVMGDRAGPLVWTVSLSVMGLVVSLLGVLLWPLLIALGRPFPRWLPLGACVLFAVSAMSLLAVLLSFQGETVK